MSIHKVSLELMLQSIGVPSRYTFRLSTFVRKLLAMVMFVQPVVPVDPVTLNLSSWFVLSKENPETVLFD